MNEDISSVYQSDPGEQAGATPLIVGIGASAGGIQALQVFFENVPAVSGIAYVVILHLSPDHDSKLTEVLQLSARVPVQKVTKKTQVKADHVYVIPPDQHLIMEGNCIALSRNGNNDAGRRAPVDIFFRTLADSHGSQAVCVILSGTGANGSMGLKRIKENGGAAFVQNPREAEFNEMPRNAIATDMVDEVLPVSEIPARIISYKNNRATILINVEAETRPEDQQKALRDIFMQLRMHTGHDFSNYKRPTLLRRIERRINIRGLHDLQSYAAFLQNNPEEVNALLKDLLISVTNFFRDRKAFAAIEQEVLPNILNTKTSEDQVRIWVAGCATGEEAYSIAMLCAEMTLSVIDAPKVQIFATDIDEDALAIAREGFYTLNDAADVSPERLRRFFNKEGAGYHIRREIREMILFANHNFIKDPPFSHLDMVTCRNVLIYLNKTAQQRVMETFHFALNPGGFLFLGSSESADGYHELYSTFSREHHIFQTRKKLFRSFPVPESVPAFRTEQSRPANTTTPETRKERITFGDLHQRLLEEYAAPSIVVNEEYDIVHVSERAGRYLQVPGGEPSQNLLKLVKQELRLELRSALYQAVQRQTPVEARGIKVGVNDNFEIVNIHIKPVFRQADIAQGFILVLFERSAEDAASREVVISSDEPVARQLEEELMRLKTQLRASIEQHEFHAEELKASNEELQAMNEELRSATEELETSKEELQSMNEELRTVNQELKVKIEETTLTSNNLQNLINSTSIGTIFLDRSFRIALFTPAIREIFNLIPADHGRPLTDITHRLEYQQLLQDAETVLEKLHIIQREVQTTDKRVYLMRVLPYRTAEDRINGVVITFVDITGRVQAEKGLRDSEERYRMLFNSMDEGYFLADVIYDENGNPADILYIDANPAAVRIMGQDYTGRRLKEIDTDFEPYWYEIFGKVAVTGESQRLELYAKPLKAWFSFYVSKVGKQEQRRVAILFQDVTQRRIAEEALRESEERFRATVSHTAVAICRTDAKGRLTFANKEFCEMLGYDEQEVVGKAFWLFTYEEDRRENIEVFEQLVREGKPISTEIRLVGKNETIKWVNVNVSVICDQNRNPESIVAVVFDVTERKALEQQKDMFIGIASHELKTPVTSIKAYVEVLQRIMTEAGDTETLGFINKLNSQIDRLSGLMHALLDTTRISEGYLALQRSIFGMSELVEERVDELRRLTMKHNFILELDGEAQVWADRERIGQVLTNLVSNAMKYSPAGGDIIISVKIVSGQVAVTVRDNGIGIDEAVRDKIFERFYRVCDANNKIFSGLGLGLYIAAEIIRRHNGRISVDSQPGEGATFRFTLPLAKSWQ